MEQLEIREITSHRLRPAESAFGVLDELPSADDADDLEIASRLLSRPDQSVPLFAGLSARAQRTGRVLTVRGTEPFDTTTISWPQDDALVLLNGNPVGNPYRLRRVTNTPELEALVRDVADEVGHEPGRKATPSAVLLRFLETTLQNAVDHGGGNASVAVAQTDEMFYACVADLGPGIAATVLEELAQGELAVQLVLAGVPRRALRLLTSSIYNHPGTSLTVRSSGVQMQLGPVDGYSRTPPVYRRRDVTNIGTYTAIAVARTSGSAATDSEET